MWQPRKFSYKEYNTFENKKTHTNLKKEKTNFFSLYETIAADAFAVKNVIHSIC